MLDLQVSTYFYLTYNYTSSPIIERTLTGEELAGGSLAEVPKNDGMMKRPNLIVKEKVFSEQLSLAADYTDRREKAGSLKDNWMKKAKK